jgi:hypothetical protein
MKKKPICAFTVAYGRAENLMYAGMMVNSIKKFHHNIPVIVFSDEDVEKIKDPNKTFRMYATFGKELSKEYEAVIQIDSDSIITGSLNHIFDDHKTQLASPCNNNLIDPRLVIHDIPDQVYVNAGLVYARGERFWNWWDELNHRIYFQHYRFGEQDTLNLIFHYGDLKSKLMDFDYGNNWHGLIHKGQWHKFILRGKDIVLPKEDGVCDADKTIKVIHWAGGPVPKMNFHTYFREDVVKRLQELISDTEK